MKILAQTRNEDFIAEKERYRIADERFTTISQLFLESVSSVPSYLLFGKHATAVTEAVASLGKQVIELITYVRWINGNTREFLRAPGDFVGGLLKTSATNFRLRRCRRR